MHFSVTAHCVAATPRARDLHTRRAPAQLPAPGAGRPGGPAGMKFQKQVSGWEALGTCSSRWTAARLHRCAAASPPPPAGKNTHFTKPLLFRIHTTPLKRPSLSLGARGQRRVGRARRCKQRPEDKAAMATAPQPARRLLASTAL